MLTLAVIIREVDMGEGLAGVFTHRRGTGGRGRGEGGVCIHSGCEGIGKGREGKTPPISPV